VVAIYSHFGPGKFPANWNTVLYCVVAYCVLNLVLVIFCNIKEGDSFLITHPKPVRAAKTVAKVEAARCRYALQAEVSHAVANQVDLFWITHGLSVSGCQVFAAAVTQQQ
jgi:hypothetical protein